MTREEFEKLNAEHDLPRELLGEFSYGYKYDGKWSEIPADEIIYIPEDAYYTSGSLLPHNYISNIEDIFTKADFIKLCGNEELAERVFYHADGKFPDDIICSLEEDDNEEFGFTVNSEIKFFTKKSLLIGIEYKDSDGDLLYTTCRIHKLIETIDELRAENSIITRTFFESEFEEELDDECE